MFEELKFYKKTYKKKSNFCRGVPYCDEWMNQSLCVLKKQQNYHSMKDVNKMRLCWSIALALKTKTETLFYASG